MPKSTMITIFRVVAFLEALSWIALLIAMVIKRVNNDDDAIAVPGLIHGVVFSSFLVVVIVTAVALRWNWKVILLAVFSAVPPLGSVIFERWATKSGHLLDPERASDSQLSEKL